jgi:hypothetical protein
MTEKGPEQSLNRSLIDTLANSDLRDVAKDTAEVLVDSFLTDGLLKEIPIVRTIAGLAKAGIGIRDRLFVEKVIRFLSPLSEYSAEQRKAYLKSLDAEDLKNASEYLILYLDRLDSIEKASMLGKVFQAYMVGKIKYRHMLYFVHFIDSVFILVWQDYHAAIKALHDKSRGPRIHEEDALALEKVGFYKEKHKGVERMDRNSYQLWLKGIERGLILTDAGWDFIRVVFELWVDEDDERPYHRSQLSVSLKAR